jgi:medium-chain acyl-[acyl-carrier-protein] hydrolase
MKLYCFTPAGSGASFYRPWQKQAGAGLEIVPFQLPGRENLFGQTPLTAIEDMVALWVKQTPIPRFQPYAMFGHSMGALVVFEALRQLRAKGLPTPLLAIFSAHQAPHLELKAARIAQLPDGEFMRNVHALGGIQPEVLANDELVEFILPALRSDFAACENYRFTPHEPLDVPFLVLGGETDGWLDADGLEGWRRHTTEDCAIEIFPGGHFYFHDRLPSLLRLIERRVNLAGTSPNRRTG